MTTESAGQDRESRNLDGLTPEERLKVLGLELPSVPSAVGNYEPWVEVNGVIYTSGQLPWIDGEMKYTGKLRDKLTVEDGYQSFRISAMNAIAQLKSAVGESCPASSASCASKGLCRRPRTSPSSRRR